MANQNALDMDKNIKALQRQADWMEKKESRLQNAHRALWLTFFLGLLGLLAAVYFVFIDYYLNGKQDTLYNGLIQTSNAEIYQQQLGALQAQNLRINANYSLVNYKKNHDLVAFVYNPNETWYAEVDFYFQGSGATSEKSQTVIMPKSTQPIWLMDQSGEAWQTARVVLENVVWKRATNYPDLKSEFMNFSVDNIELTELADEVAESSHSILNFTITNKSVYNFWNVGLAIVLRRYDEVVAFYYFEAPQLKGLESRPISLNLFDEFKAISDTEITPLMNVFDSDNIYRK
jgi:hypothetical protein